MTNVCEPSGSLNTYPAISFGGLVDLVSRSSAFSMSRTTGLSTSTSPVGQLMYTRTTTDRACSTKELLPTFATTTYDRNRVVHRDR